VSHKLNEVLEISEAIIVMRNGQVVSTGAAGDYTTTRLVFEMTGQSIAEKSYDFTPDLSQPALLRVDGLTVPGALQDVSFELRRGEIVGVTGLLGSGRTELALALFGMLPIAGGHIEIDETPVKIRSVQDAIAHGIGYVPEDRLTEGLFLEQADRAQHRRAHHRQAARRVGLDRPGAGEQQSTTGLRRCASRHRIPSCRSRRSRAAISSASWSPSGWPATRG
jgi:simple sugar transport system ATP-binding protein